MRIGPRRKLGLKALVGFAIVESGNANRAPGFRLSALGLPCLQLRAFQLHQHLRKVAIAG